MKKVFDIVIVLTEGSNMQRYTICVFADNADYAEKLVINRYKESAYPAFYIENVFEHTPVPLCKQEGGDHV